MKPILIINNIAKSYNGLNVLKSFSLKLLKGEIILLIGDNGTGKTTLFNIITGLEKIKRGNIIYKDNRIENQSIISISKKGILRMYQQPRVFKNLFVWENLYSASKNHSLFNKKQNTKEYTDLLSRFNLNTYQNDLAGDLSYGQQKIISFCMLVIADPDVFLLDEPFSGLGKEYILVLKDFIIELKNKGKSFIIIEHNVTDALDIADRSIRIRNGINEELIYD